MALVLTMFSSLAWGGNEVNGVRMWQAPESTRLVFDTSGPVEHSLFTLKNPDRLVIDLKDTKLKADTDKLDLDNSLLTGIRSAERNGRHLRVVLDLKQEVKPKSFVLRPNEEYGHRLVIDLQHLGAQQAERVARTVESFAPQGKARDVVIAIDAGHGGDDPGAIGPTGVREKDVVLAIARKLKEQIEREPGMRAVMIRDGDYFIPLKNRVQLARERYRADLFVSVHADSFRDKRASGSSVYTLSPHGASSEQARLLAEKENASDLIGGVSLDDKDDLLASVLLDLSQTASIEASSDVASRVLSGLKSVNRLHKSRVEQAAFRVLKSPDLPSILVETAFISNPKEERLLRTTSYQQKLADAIMSGVRGYFRQNPPPGTVLAQAKGYQHVISEGDTLSGIARQYRVSLDTLRNANGLTSSRLIVGQVLHIPSGS